MVWYMLSEDLSFTVTFTSTCIEFVTDLYNWLTFGCWVAYPVCCLTDTLLRWRRRQDTSVHRQVSYQDVVEPADVSRCPGPATADDRRSQTAQVISRDVMSSSVVRRQRGRPGRRCRLKETRRHIQTTRWRPCWPTCAQLRYNISF